MKLFTRSLLFLTLIFSVSCHTVQFERASEGETLNARRMSSDLLDLVFGIGDKNKDGEISLDESYRVHPKTDEVKFAAADTNGSGGLTKRELDRAMIARGSYAALISDTDKNSDGVISTDEAAAYRKKIDSARSARTFAQLERAMASQSR